MTSHSPVQLEIRPGPESAMSITDPFGAGRWVERLWIMRDRILDPADEWQNTPHLPWETEDPESDPVRFEAVGLDSPWNRSRSREGFVSGILRQFIDSREFAFGYTFAASAWQYLGERTRACAMLRRALTMDPGYVPAYVVRAMVGFSEDAPRERIADVNRALELDPEYVPALIARVMFGPDGDDINSPLEALDKALRLNSNYADTFVIASGAMEGLGDDEVVLGYLNRALDIDPASIEAYRSRADWWVGRMEWQKAAADLHELLKLAPGDASARLAKIAAHLFLDQGDEADSEASYLVDTHPDSPQFLLTRADIRISDERYDDAVEDLNAVIRMDPEAAEGYFRRGQLWYGIEDYARAIDDFTRALAIKPDYLTALVHRGLALLKVERFAEALVCANAALAIDGEDLDGLYVRGRSHIEMGQYKRAMPDLNRILQQDPDDVAARCYRGLAREKTGNRKGARKDYARAYRKAVEFGNEKGAALAVRLFPDLKQHQARR